MSAKRRVLIIDDEDDILWSLSLLLEPTYEVATAADGKAALRAVEQQRFDALILDLMMPVMDGAAVKRELDARGITTPVVIVSAFSDVAERAASLGVRDYMTKPIDIPKLEATLARLTRGEPPPGATPSDKGPSLSTTGRSQGGSGARAHATDDARRVPPLAFAL